jgi:hypothetical protein
MSDRTTLRDLERLIGRIGAYSETLGIIDADRGERLGLDQGSATYGRAWRIFSTGLDGNSGHSDPFHLGSGYLGWSKAEAHLTLRGLEAGLWRAIVALETRNKARATSERAHYLAELSEGKQYRVSAYASVDVSAENEAEALQVAFEMLATDLKPRDFDLVAEEVEPDLVTHIEAEETTHGKPASEMRTALLRLGEIVREIDLDQPINL